MKLIIAGSRDLHFGTQIIDVSITGIQDLRKHIPWCVGYDPKLRITEVVSGGAKGIDETGEKWVESLTWEMPDRKRPKLTRFEAEWDKYGSRAGPIRNNKMAVYADALLLIWDGKSSGSQHMKNAMLKLGKPVYEVIFRSFS